VLDLVASCGGRLVVRSRDTLHSSLQVEGHYSLVVVEAHKRVDVGVDIVAVGEARMQYIVVEMVGLAELLRDRLSKGLLGSRLMRCMKIVFG
jgi:hypothetical protein